MERKGRSTVEVSSEELATALPRAKLSAEEEKVLRMRGGIGVADRHEPLPRASGNDPSIADELLLVEMQLFRASRKRAGPGVPRTGAVRARVSVAKTKIIRALRKKK
jgi:hypothetical protein